MARLTLRLSGTEKQRDDALEALVLQQEIAEELERERKRNQKELAALQHTNSALSQQRDEAQRVVLHLRSLINGQTHHMEHLVRTINSTADLHQFIEQGYEDAPEESATEGPESDAETEYSSTPVPTTVKETVRPKVKRSPSGVANDMTPELEQHLLNIDKAQNRLARLSITDVADRYLRDKTDAIAEIIRNISEQCAAAVEGLHMAQDAAEEQAQTSEEAQGKSLQGENRLATEYDGQDDHSARDGSELGDGDNNSLHPDQRHSSIPPTPDLVHNRSSTSMSMLSSSTFPERSSQQYNPGDIPTRIVEDDDEHAHEAESFDAHTQSGTVSKPAAADMVRPPTTRIVA